MLIMGANFNDTVELWLEAIRYAGEGFHVEVLAGAISKPDLSQGSSDHILVWVERPLNAAQKARQAAWLEKGVPLAATGPGVKPLIKPKGGRRTADNATARRQSKPCCRPTNRLIRRNAKPATPV